MAVNETKKEEKQTLIELRFETVNGKKVASADIQGTTRDLIVLLGTLFGEEPKIKELMQEAITIHNQFMDRD